MKLIKTSLFSGIITLIRISSGFISSKVIAIYTGTSGVALVGAFSNFITIVLTFANGAINTGVIKYTAEYEGDKDKLKSLFSTSLKISFYCSGIVGILLLLLSSFLSNLVFVTDKYSYLIKIFGGTIILYSLNSLLIAILNGKKQIKVYTIVNTIGSIVGLLFTLILVYFFKLEGALYALVLSQSIVFFVTVFMIAKSDWYNINYFKNRFDIDIFKKLSHYSLMAIVTALTVPVSQIVLRNMLIGSLGIESAGIWQGMMRISDGYLMIITTSLSTYFLPKLSSIKNNIELRDEIFKGYKLIIPFVLLSCFGIYFFRFILIKLFFTSDFIDMEQLFLWQLIGDFFKITAWVLAYVMLAKSMTKMYIFSEIVFGFSYVILGYLFSMVFQLEGVVIAFAVNYFFYFLFVLIAFRKLLF
ncbi:O-antigen translocase [Flavobacterium aquiphilum]|uniref:O-antigen translocase n=1 Tax=Flavobacterium aquiphilum TaxID=3003261 RepID=UPI0024808634|nr:O-antigen translocase [Flavobacterium aquiphilum]